MANKSTKTQRLKNAFRQKLENMGLKADRWGNFKIELDNGSKYRIKINKTSFRYEKHNGFGWRMLNGCYFSNTPKVDGFLDFIKINYGE